MPTTMEILETSYLDADSIPLATSKPVAPIFYDDYWASSGTLEFAVEDDRLAANPINRLDPTGLWVSLSDYQLGFIPNRGKFNVTLKNDGLSHSHLDLHFTPSGPITTDGCTEVRLIQIITYQKVTYWGLYGLLWNKENHDIIDADRGTLFYPFPKTGIGPIWKSPTRLGLYETDTPGASPTATVLEVDQEFRTYAVATDGPEKGHSYGYVEWGQQINLAATHWSTSSSITSASRWVTGIKKMSGEASDPMVIGPADIDPQPGSLAGYIERY